jgi:hypothetical protein
MYICTSVNPNENYHAEAKMSLVIIVNGQTSTLVMAHKESYVTRYLTISTHKQYKNISVLCNRNKSILYFKFDVDLIGHCHTIVKMLLSS